MTLLKKKNLEHIFRAYDVRGVFNVDLTVETVTNIGLAFGSFLKEESNIAISRDGRLTSEVVENAFAAGAASTGLNIEKIGLVPIQVLNFWVWRNSKRLNGGVVVTASHNPPQFNGLRFRHGDGTGYTWENQEIKKIFFKKDFREINWLKCGKIKLEESSKVCKSYMDFVKERVTLRSKLKVVLDVGNGAASVLAPSVFKEVGAKVKVINSEINGLFPNRSPDPLEDPLNELRETVVSENADLGVGFDGDGDRAIIVDDKGRKVKTEIIGLILADYLARKNDSVVVGSSSSMILEEKLGEKGIKVFRTRVGDVFISEKLKEKKGVLGVEPSAHLFVSKYGFYFDDALLASLKLSEYLTEKKKKLSELINEIPEFPLKRVNLECPDEKKFALVKELEEDFKQEGYRTEYIDGVRIILDEGWVLIRPSNTEPKIRITAEAKTNEKLRKYFEEFKERVSSKIKGLEKLNA